MLIGNHFSGTTLIFRIVSWLSYNLTITKNPFSLCANDLAHFIVDLSVQEYQLSARPGSRSAHCGARNN